MSINGIKTAIAKAPKKMLEETNKLGNFVTSKLPTSKDKADVFVKSTDKFGKNTVVGGAILLGAIGLAIGCIKTMHSKVTDIKENN